MKELILYYSLEDEASRLVFDDADSTENRDDKVEKALASNPFVVMSALGYHLGVDCDAIHDRVQQFKFLKGMKTKRSAKSNDDGDKIVKRTAIRGKRLSLPGVEIHGSHFLSFFFSGIVLFVIFGRLLWSAASKHSIGRQCTVD